MNSISTSIKSNDLENLLPSNILYEVDEKNGNIFSEKEFTSNYCINQQKTENQKNMVNILN